LPAARRANERCDESAARNLLERALPLTSEGQAIHLRVVLDLADLRQAAGELAGADELLLIAERVGVNEPLVVLERLEWLHRARPHEATALIDARLPALLAELERRGDERGMAKAHMVAFSRYWLASQATPSAVEVRLAAEHARKAGAGGLRARALAWYLVTNLFGPKHVSTMASELDEIENQEPSAYLRSFVEICRSAVDLLEQRYDDARRWALRSIESSASLGSSMEGWGWSAVSRVELAVGDYPAAIVAAERGDRILHNAGETGFRSTTQAELSELHEQHGDRHAAATAIALSVELGAPEDVINYAITHRVRARMACADGDLDTAERWARSAVDYAFKTDFAIERGHARLELARVLSACERTHEALEDAREALAIYKGKGDRNGIEQATALLADLEQRG
jgi:tetratricopeptide (TPR) repeat protein